MSKALNVEAQDALKAFNMVYDIVDQTWPEGSRPTAAQIVLDPGITRQMRELVEKVREENK